MKLKRQRQSQQIDEFAVLSNMNADWKYRKLSLTAPVMFACAFFASNTTICFRGPVRFYVLVYLYSVAVGASIPQWVNAV